MNIKMLLLVAMLGICALEVSAEDWPQWRGPRRDGISVETNMSAKWPLGGPKLVSKLTDLGFGYGSVSVIGGLVYSLGSTGTESEFVSVHNLASGKRLWSTRIGKVGNPDQQPNYPGARSAPTVDGALLYAFSSDGDLACLDTATGRVRWSKSMRSEFGGKPGVWAYSESPLVEGNKVIVSPVGDSATMVALDKRTGSVVWKSLLSGGDMGSYASAMVATVAGKRQVIQYLGKGLVGLDLATGAFLWRFDKTLDTRFGMHALTPVISESMIYSAAATSGGVAKIQESGSTFTASTVYIERKLPSTIGGAVKVGKYVYGTTSTALVCIDFATGKLQWENRSVGPGSICAVDGKLVVHGENGEVALVSAAPTGYVELGRFTPEGGPDRGSAKAWAHPVVSGGKLYIRDLGTLWVYAVGAK